MRQQVGVNRAETARIVVVTHSAKEAALSAVVEELRGLTEVQEVCSVMRVEGE